MGYKISQAHFRRVVGILGDPDSARVQIYMPDGSYNIDQLLGPTIKLVGGRAQDYSPVVGTLDGISSERLVELYHDDTSPEPDFPNLTLMDGQGRAYDWQSFRATRSKENPVRIVVDSVYWRLKENEPNPREVTGIVELTPLELKAYRTFARPTPKLDELILYALHEDIPASIGRKFFNV